MATSKNKPAVTGTLAPTVVKNETQAMDIATTSGRKRPFVAINDDGKMVVCSRRTASKYGWEAQGALYTRSGGDKAPAKKAAPAKKLAPWDAAAEKSKQAPKEAVVAANPVRNLSRTVRNVVKKELRNLFNEKR